VQPKTISRRNKKRHNGTTGMAGKYHLKNISATTKKLTQQHNWKNVPPAHG
jgi:hypothetical protein